MFLNLKSKKIVDSTLNIQIKNQSNLNSYREATKERPNRQSRQIKSTRQHHNPITKKPTTSTAISTLTANPNSYTTIRNHCKNYSQQSKQKQMMEDYHHSRQKIDAMRIANVYKKIKKFQIPQSSLQFDSNQKQQDKGKKYHNGSQRISNKKELLNTITNKFMCATESEERHNIRIQEDNQRQSKNQLALMLQPFIELFSWQMDSKETVSVPLRTRVHSKEAEVHRSIENSQRNTSKQGKKKSNDILIRQSSNNPTKQQIESMSQSITRFMYIMQQTHYKIKNIEGESKFKYIEQPCFKLLHKLLGNIEYFILEIYQKCIKEMDRCQQKIQATLVDLIKQQDAMHKKCQQLQILVSLERHKTQQLHRIMQEARNKNIFAEAIIAEVSHLFDIDSYIRCKLQDELEAQYKGTNQLEKDQYTNLHFQIVKSQQQKVDIRDQTIKQKNKAGLGNYKQLQKSSTMPKNQYPKSVQL